MEKERKVKGGGGNILLKSLNTLEKENRTSNEATRAQQQMRQIHGEGGGVKI